jgi:hypothetical protein
LTGHLRGCICSIRFKGIATEDITTDDGKNAAAVALGRMGGKARAAGLTAKKRKERKKSR